MPEINSISIRSCGHQFSVTHLNVISSYNSSMLNSALVRVFALHFGIKFGRKLLLTFSSFSIINFESLGIPLHYE